MQVLLPGLSLLTQPLLSSEGQTRSHFIVKVGEKVLWMHCWKEIGDFQIICSKVGGFRPFNYLLGVTCYLLSLKCKWLVLNKLCNFTAYKLFVSTNKQLSDPMDSMADPLFSSYSVWWRAYGTICTSLHSELLKLWFFGLLSTIKA